MTRKDDYHIRVKNLNNNKEMGFMLTSGDKPFTIQGMDNQATRVSEGELLYSDFTNSRVFAQSDWGNGVSKYWNPERFYSTIYPSRQYGDANNIYIGNGEFSLGNGVEVAEDFTGTGIIQAYCNGEAPGVVYAAQKVGLKIYRSTDYGMTWSVWKDLLAVPYTARFTGYTGFADMKFCNTAFGAKGGEKEAGEGGQYLWFIATKNDGSSLTGRITIRVPYQYYGYDKIWDTNAGSLGSSPSYLMDFYIRPHETYGTISATINTDKSIGSATSYATYTLTWTYDGVSRSYATVPLFGGTGPEEPLFVPGQQIRLVGSTTTYRTITGKFIVAGDHRIYIDGDYSVGGPYDCTVYPGDVIVVPVSSASLPSLTDSLLYTSQYGLRFSTLEYDGYDYCVIGAIITGTSTTRVIGSTFTPYTIATTNWDLQSSYLIIRNIYSGSSAFDFMGRAGTTYLPPYSSFIGQQEQVPYKYSKLFVTNNIQGDEVFSNENLTSEWNVRTLGGQIISGVRKLGYNNIYGVGNLIYNGDTKNNLDLSNFERLDLDIGYYATSSTSDGDDTTLIGTQFGSDEYGTQAIIYKIIIAGIGTAPAITKLQTFGEQSISAMHYAFGYYWVATNLKGNIYLGTPTNGTSPTINFDFILQMPQIDEFGSTYIDSMTDYNGKVVLSYQKGAGVYAIDPVLKREAISGKSYYATDALCSLPITAGAGVRITNLLNTGRRLLIGTNQAVELYSFSNGTIASIGYMQSSIYGGYISNVAKLWQYVYVRVNPGTFDNLQKIAFEVSYDDNVTWQYVPIVKGQTYYSSSLTYPTVWDDPKYYHTKTSTPNYTNDNKMLVFFFPYNEFQNTIAYRCWLKTGASTKRLTINHIGVHFNIAYRQEMLINYNIAMKPRDELLDGRRADVWTNNDRLTFLKDIWQNMYQVEVTHIDGKKYTCIPFSDDRTPGQGYVLTTQNANSARQDFDNLEYNLLFTLKTIANFSEIL